VVALCNVSAADAGDGASIATCWSPATRPGAREVVVGTPKQPACAPHAGSLENAAAAEALTSVLIFMNKRYGGLHTGIRITGIADDAS
jgi:hypothetical protein